MSISRSTRRITTQEEVCDAGQLAVEFCGPLFLMYSMYDRGVSRDRIIAYTERHVEDFSRRLEGMTKGGGAV